MSRHFQSQTELFEKTHNEDLKSINNLTNKFKTEEPIRSTERAEPQPTQSSIVVAATPTEIKECPITQQVDWTENIESKYNTNPEKFITTVTG